MQPNNNNFMYNLPYSYYTPNNNMNDNNMNFSSFNILPSVAWVQGEVGAKAYPIAAGNTLFLFDSENNLFYLKTADKKSNIPTMSEYIYFKKGDINSVQQYLNHEQEQLKATTTNQVEQNNYVTKEEFNQLLIQLQNLNTKLKEQKENNNGSVVISGSSTKSTNEQPEFDFSKIQ